MHAFLLVGDNPEETEKEIDKLTKKYGTTPLEFSIDKIEKTRELSSFLKLSQPPNTTIIIREIDEATVDSLNAFLKNLEEPNANITFILQARNEFKVIPTITSRCQIIRIKKAVRGINKQSLQLSEKFTKGSIGEKFQIIEKSKKREDAVIFLQNLLEFLQSKITQSKTNLTGVATPLEITQQTLDAVNQNGNVTMQLTNMVVKMEKNTGGEDSDKV